jgi:hypothetical protein
MAAASESKGLTYLHLRYIVATRTTPTTPSNQTTTTPLHLYTSQQQPKMLLRDHILFTTWLGSWAEKVKRQGYDAITLPNLLLARRRRHAWAVAAGLERSESVAKRVCLALKSYDAAKALERPERRESAGRGLSGSESQASKKTHNRRRS